LFDVTGLFQGEQDAKCGAFYQADFPGDLFKGFAEFAEGQRFKNGQSLDYEVDVRGVSKELVI